MSKRVVVTGLGVVSAVGNNITDYWQSLLAGKCGVAKVKAFDTTNFDCKIGADANTAAVIHISEINKNISAIAAEKKESFYIEVLVKPGMKPAKKS